MKKYPRWFMEAKSGWNEKQLENYYFEIISNVDFDKSLKVLELDIQSIEARIKRLESFGNSSQDDLLFAKKLLRRKKSLRLKKLYEF
ncbi:hypothetical protein [Paenibacillus sp. Soil724D2]|uniref:hypothetical protein n=1 Tax=Paenibacillus sp. (strain Soil724D2) TaxID=1736392 RepID=UPI000715A356|nr:hypothetical protein [Paenibacillus sp. Soil724D2]KRE48377.1 hypothetical protein ASG85_05080 [Paenibacillus sp. Soil724D2]